MNFTLYNRDNWGYGVGFIYQYNGTDTVPLPRLIRVYENIM